MKVLYRPEFNIDLGAFNALHPFDGKKFAKVRESISGIVEVEGPDAPVTQEAIDSFVDPLLRRLIRGKRYVMQALEVPYISILPFRLIESRVLEPMRWAVAATIQGAKMALRGESCRNLSGGYHHASRRSAEGFCVYNDIGMAYDYLTQNGQLSSADRVLILDVDAHHGNGNADVFMENRNVTLLDVYNKEIYPQTHYTRERVDIGVPLRTGTAGSEYLDRLSGALKQLHGSFRLAFVVAGTDVLASDPLGGLGLSIEDCVNRDAMISTRLRELSIASIFVSGGGYSADSAPAMTASIRREASSMRLQRVLIIDDDPAVLQSLGSALRSEGYSVVAADGVKAGISAFSDAHEHGAPFEVVITDLNLPQIDGMTVAAKIRKVSASTPVIMLTGWGNELPVPRGESGQVDRVISTPPEFTEVRRALRELA